MRFLHVRLFVFVIFASSLLADVCSQTDPVFTRQINASDGLSSSEYNYFLYRDSYGYLWISAMDGLNRYDGHTIRQYFSGKDSPHDMWDNNIQSDLVEDEWGNLWFTTAHGLNVYDRHSDLIQSIIPESDPNLLDGAVVLGLCPARNKLLLQGPSDLSTQRILYEVDLETQEATKVEADSTLTGRKIFFLGENESGWEYLTIYKKRLNHIAGSDTGLQVLTSFLLDTIPEGRLYDLKIFGEEYALIAHSNGLFQVDLSSGKVDKILDSDSTGISQIVDMECYQDSLLLLASRNEGLFFYDLYTEETHQLTVSEDEKLYQFSNGVSRLYADRDGNYWLSTDGDGIYQINLKRDLFRTLLPAERFPQLQESVTWVDQSDEDGTIWIATMRSIYALDAACQFLPALTRSTADRLKKVKSGARVFCLLTGADGELLVGTETGLFLQVDRLSQFQELTESENRLIVTSLSHLQDGRILIGASELPPMTLDLSDQSFHPFPGAPTLKTPMHVLELRQGGLLLGNTEKELFYIPHFHEGDSFEGFQPIKVPGQILSIVAVGQAEELFVGTEEGIRQLHRTGDELVLSNELKYETRGLKSIEVEGNGILWLGTNQGIEKFDVVSGETEVYSVADGLASNGATLNFSPIVLKDKILFPSQNGLSFFQRNQVRPDPPVYPPRVTDILVNEAPVTRFVNSRNERVAIDGGEILEFEPSQRTLTFVLSGLNLHDPASQRYVVRLTPDYEVKFEMEDRYLARFTNLDPGLYTLEIEAHSSGEIQRSSLSFRIHPYWYERTSVQLGGIIAVLILMGAAANYQIRNLRRDRELAETKAANFELDLKVRRVQNDVLRQQMNPHFLNNALNVVLARTRDRQVLHGFVGKVSGLVRDIFNFAWKEQISLEEELVMLERYLSAEKAIRGIDLTWSFDLPEEENPANIDIPPMILQPFAENAIKHGFVAAGRTEGHIDLTMTIDDEDRLRLQLTDNGAGRDPDRVSEHYADPDKPSAIKVVEQRLELINNQIGESVATLGFEDLTDQQGKPAGTRVVLVLPV